MNLIGVLTTNQKKNVLEIVEKALSLAFVHGEMNLLQKSIQQNCIPHAQQILKHALTTTAMNWKKWIRKFALLIVQVCRGLSN